EGLSRCSTEAKNASRSRCNTDGSARMRPSSQDAVTTGLWITRNSFADTEASWGMRKRTRRTAVHTARKPRPDLPTNAIQVHRASSITDHHSSVPALFDFHAQRTLAMRSHNSKRIDSRAHADIPALEHAEQCAHSLMHPLCEQRTDAVLLVAYADPEG